MTKFLQLGVTICIFKKYKLETLTFLAHLTQKCSGNCLPVAEFVSFYSFSGGSSGIGRGAVLLLSKLGCSVAFGGRNKEELDKVAAQCKETRSDVQVLITLSTKNIFFVKLSIEEIKVVSEKVSKFITQALSLKV